MCYKSKETKADIGYLAFVSSMSVIFIISLRLSYSQQAAHYNSYTLIFEVPLFFL